MKFQILTNKQIQVTSDSGHVYKIVSERCSCKSFYYKKTCKHIDEALKAGIFNQLDQNKPDKNIALRKDAIRQFLKKKNISFSESDVDFIESKLTCKTTPEEMISWVKG